jgi:NAD(P)-dependent dehydrogenase (short-subunit alcohol dehydrogenase family)
MAKAKARDAAQDAAPSYPEMRGRLALVTGGSSGIGLATAKAFAAQGARVVIASRHQTNGRAAAESLSKSGEVHYLPVDTADGASVTKLFAAIKKQHGKLDYAFNNGGSGAGGKVATLRESNWRRTIDGYLTSTFLCLQAELNAMGKDGVIVNNSSVDGLRGYPFPGGAAYSAAKHGVLGLTKSAALEHAKSGPRICAICPGWVATPPVLAYTRTKERADGVIRQTPRGRIGTPEEIASTVLWLCSAGASFAIGTVLAIDGGYMA